MLSTGGSLSSFEWEENVRWFQEQLASRNIPCDKELIIERNQFVNDYLSRLRKKVKEREARAIQEVKLLTEDATKLELLGTTPPSAIIHSPV